jgi:hypothetical protein
VVTSWETQNANVTMSQLAQLTARRIIIFTGNILNSSKLTLGDGSATLNPIQIGNTTTPTAAGAFDVAPTFNLGTGGEHLAYLRTTASRSTGVEVEPGRAPVNLTYDDNNASHTLTIAGGDISVSGTTALTNGRVITNANRLIANGALTRTTGYVDGLLQKPVATGSPVVRTFEVGDAVAYSPINVTFASVTGAGAVTGHAAGGDHAQIGSSGIDASKSANRNWTLTNTGTSFTTADAVLNFAAGDIDGGANANNFVVRKYDAPELVGAGNGHADGHEHAGDRPHVVQRLRRRRAGDPCDHRFGWCRADRSRPRVRRAFRTAAIRPTRSRRTTATRLQTSRWMAARWASSPATRSRTCRPITRSRRRSRPQARIRSSRVRARVARSRRTARPAWRAGPARTTRSRRTRATRSPT